MTYTTDQYEGLIAETITVTGANGDPILAYFARPLGPGPFPAVLLIHHLPGWDEFYRETARRYAHHGYLCLSPDLYCRAGHGAPRTWRPRSAPRAACPTTRSWATRRAASTCCARTRRTTARWA